MTNYKVDNLIEKKTAVIILLLIAIGITGVGWLSAALNLEIGGSPPSGVDNFTEYFRGYEAYLDRRIFASIVHGFSMEPTLMDNDLILWVHVDVGELKVGDIILFRHPTMPYIDNVVHRIAEIHMQDGKYLFLTKGDKLPETDRHLLSESSIHGLVIGVIYRNNH